MIIWSNLIVYNTVLPEFCNLFIHIQYQEIASRSSAVMFDRLYTSNSLGGDNGKMIIVKKNSVFMPDRFLNVSKLHYISKYTHV